LGNPGKKYEGTRHNVGFEVIRFLAQRHAATAGRLRFDGELAEAAFSGEKTLLVMPQTFMNLSGRCVRQTMDFFKLTAADLLVVCDDFNLPLGTLRLRAAGSDGGQKGLADTARQLGTDEFARLRLGIGPVPPQWDPADFVLGRFAASEQQVVADQIARAADAVQTWVAEGIAPAMNRFNAGRPTENKENQDAPGA
jgi:peptidyl-tRNA hydrolase, PTH1 family